ncbi:hypothetical protein V6N13_021869 [Hibiscus sabdariffa]|uniref:Uncharacterized protein n=1 Tax=Hibiscus sabdariffa TaxID=183260 RepID=A0ABR2CPX4_9ROSI
MSLQPRIKPGLKDGLLFAALSDKAQGKDVGIPECEGAASAKSPWNAPELFNLSVLEGESIREWLFFNKSQRAFGSEKRKQRLELKLVDGKKNSKGKLASDTVVDLQKQIGTNKRWFDSLGLVGPTAGATVVAVSIPDILGFLHLRAGE